MDLKELHKAMQSEAHVAYGTGIYDGVEAVFIYRPDNWKHIDNKILFTEEYSVKEENSIAGHRIVNRKLEILGMEPDSPRIPENRYLGEQCGYWIGELEGSGKAEKHAYPFFEGKKGLDVVLMVEGIGKRYYHEGGEHHEYEEVDGEFVKKRYDFIYPSFDFIETKIVDGIAHDERDGWCFQLDCDEYPCPQFDIAFTMEEAIAEAQERLRIKIKPLEQSIEYLEKLK